MKIYIAGKVTGAGTFAEVTMKFGAAQVEVQKRGHYAINPLEVVSQWYDQEPRPYRFLQTPWHTCMRLCIAALMQAEAVYMLPCWQNSRGAQLEHTIATALQLPIFYQLSAVPHEKV